jgi:hypothetical protein
MTSNNLKEEAGAAKPPRPPLPGKASPVIPNAVRNLFKNIKMQIIRIDAIDCLFKF